MRVFVDTSVIFDVIAPSPFAEWSSQALGAAAQSARLVVNAIVYAEAAAGASTPQDMDLIFPSSSFEIEDIPLEAAYVAGKAFASYRRRGGTRTLPLPDFFIGAHALVRGYTLLTRDAARCRTCFPALKLIAPP